MPTDSFDRRTDDHTQTGQRRLLSEQWEKDDLVEEPHRSARAVRHPEPLTQTLAGAQLERVASLGKDGPREVSRADDAALRAGASR
jgi:hypothetical protein